MSRSRISKANIVNAASTAVPRRASPPVNVALDFLQQCGSASFATTQSEMRVLVERSHENGQASPPSFLKPAGGRCRTQFFEPSTGACTPPTNSPLWEGFALTVWARLQLASLRAMKFGMPGIVNATAPGSGTKMIPLRTREPRTSSDTPSRVSTRIEARDCGVLVATIARR